MLRWVLFDYFSIYFRYLKCKTWTLNDSVYNHPKYGIIVEVETDFERLLKFTMYLGNKLIAHGNQMEIGELINMININGYYQT